ncbi:MerR family transcriptional regulator, partial [Dorea sp. 210702-DFI.3.17]|uniref:MerR family transcriptional regulator n=1 Tax=Dorea sp. 210702-DFI.3.17 TaxID=2883208 RepID=UPI001D063A48
MRTVKEISDLTGISVRTLHYYDEIGLLKPTEKSDAGYRLYDDKALETLQQILFFREFDISLKEIKAVLDNPALERNQILQVQRKMLVTKKERMERLIASIDGILKGENKMDFTIFTKTEVEEMFQTMLEHIPENMRNIAIKEFGSIEQWKKHYMEVVSSEEMQKGYAKVVEWYGGKDKFLSVARTPVSKEVAESYNKRIEAILQKLIAKQNCDIDSFEVKELVGEYGFVMKQLAQIKEEKGFMMAQAQYYRNEQIKPMIDEKYGEGASDFFAQAIENYYKVKYKDFPYPKWDLYLENS